MKQIGKHGRGFASTFSRVGFDFGVKIGFFFFNNVNMALKPSIRDLSRPIIDFKKQGCISFMGSCLNNLKFLKPTLCLDSSSIDSSRTKINIINTVIKQ